MPAFLFPQFLLCGLLVLRERMARGLEVFSDFLPMTYAYYALRLLAGDNEIGGRLARGGI